jgi:hypothetical protein
VALTKEQRLFQKQKSWAPDLPLVDEFSLIGTFESCHTQFTLREVRQKTFAEENNCCSQNRASTTNT